jgi:hypothetical protein
VLFDFKKELHQKIFDSGISWTLFHNGGIFDYFLPNLRFFEKISATFGDLDLPIYTHEIQDIGKVAAMALNRRSRDHQICVDGSQLSFPKRIVGYAQIQFS